MFLVLRWGAQLADVWTSLAFALRTCVGAPNLQTCAGAPNLRTCLALHWGTQLADVPCVALGCPTCGRALCCIALGRPTWGRALRCVGVPNLGRVDVPCVCIADVGWGAQVANVTCVALGRPTCGRALRSVGTPNLRTCLVLRLSTHLSDAPCVALGRPTLVRSYQKVCLQAEICSYPSSISSFSLVLPCVDVFIVDRFFIWVPILRMLLALRFGVHLADVPFVALGCPNLVRSH
jgi:hypothetical protein